MDEIASMADMLKHAMTVTANPRKNKHTPYYLKILEQTPKIDFTGIQPFIFADQDGTNAYVERSDEVLACPFELFSIECETNDISQNLDDFRSPYRMLAIICREISVDEYLFFVMSILDGKEVYSVVHKRNNLEAYEYLKDLVRHYLSRLNASKIGTFNAAGRAKAMINGKRQIYKPKGVIYVSDKKYQPKQVMGTRNVTWHSKWNVRAHWRKLANPETLGRDRTGERSVKGWTFISEYKKGSGAEITKVRKVK